MQNKLFTFLCTGLLAFALTSCDKDENTDSKASKLSAPVLNVTEQLSDGFTVSWQAVENASGYSYVFGSEAEKSTTATSVSFTDLEPGTYTVKVKAMSTSTDWTDSDYSTISATIEEGDPTTDELTFTFDITDITATSAVITCTPSVNDKTYFFDCMEKSLYDQIHTSDEAFSAALLESLEAMGAEYGMTLEQVLSQLLSTGVDVWDPNGLKSSTEHVAYAFGLNTDGTVTTAIATKSFTTKEATGGSDTGSWLGEWDATSTGSLVWNISGQYLEASYDENRPMDLLFTIKEEQGLTVLYGWSQVDETLPALCEINANGDLRGYLAGSIRSGRYPVRGIRQRVPRIPRSRRHRNDPGCRYRLDEGCCRMQGRHEARCRQTAAHLLRTEQHAGRQIRHHGTRCAGSSEEPTAAGTQAPREIPGVLFFACNGLRKIGRAASPGRACATGTPHRRRGPASSPEPVPSRNRAAKTGLLKPSLRNPLRRNPRRRNPRRR